MKQDFSLNQERDIQLTGSGDIRLTQSIDELVGQSAGIHIGNEVTELFGGPMSATRLQSIEASIKTALNREEDVGQVLAVNVVELDERQQSVTVDATVENAENLSLTFQGGT